MQQCSVLKLGRGDGWGVGDFLLPPAASGGAAAGDAGRQVGGVQAPPQ